MNIPPTQKDFNIRRIQAIRQRGMQYTAPKVHADIPVMNLAAKKLTGYGVVEYVREENIFSFLDDVFSNAPKVKNNYLVSNMIEDKYIQSEDRYKTISNKLQQLLNPKSSISSFRRTTRTTKAPSKSKTGRSTKKPTITMDDMLASTYTSILFAIIPESYNNIKNKAYAEVESTLSEYYTMYHGDNNSSFFIGTILSSLHPIFWYLMDAGLNSHANYSFKSLKYHNVNGVEVKIEGLTKDSFISYYFYLINAYGVDPEVIHNDFIYDDNGTDILYSQFKTRITTVNQSMFNSSLEMADDSEKRNAGRYVYLYIYYLALSLGLIFDYLTYEQRQIMLYQLLRYYSFLNMIEIRRKEYEVQMKQQIYGGYTQSY